VATERETTIEGALAPDQLGQVLREVADGITVQTADGRLLFANDAAARLIGFASAADLLATPVAELVERFEILDEDRNPMPLDRLPGREALAGVEGAEATVCYRIRATGEERWSIVRASPAHAPDGTVRYAINVFHDITERKRAELRLRFITEATTALNTSLDYEDTLARLGRLVVPGLADYCLVDLVQPDGSLRHVVLVHVDPYKEGVLQELRRRYSLAGNESHPATRAFRTGEPVLLEHVDEAALRAAAVDDRHFELYTRLNPASYLVVPLRARDRSLGTIALGMGDSGRHFGPVDVELATELADRAAVAVDNALLYEQAQSAAQRMEESHALLDHLFASSPVGLGVWDRNLRYVRVNEALARINGVPADEHIGRTLSEVVPGIAEQFESIYREVLETGEPRVQYEASAESPSTPGHERHWLTSYYPVKTRGGEVVGVGAVIMEITDRYRAEAALRESEQRFRTLADSAPVLIWMTDVDDNCTYLNQGWLDFTGRPLETELGRGWLHGVHPEDRPRVEATTAEAHVERARFTTESRLRRYDGEYRWILGEGTPRFTPDGAFAGYIGSCIDITERRLAEQRLRFLAEASRVLASSLDVETTFRRVAQLAVPTVADWCAVDIVEPDGELRRVAIEHVDPSRVAAGWELHRRFPPRPGDPGGPARVAETGESILVRELSDEYLQERVGDPDSMRLVRELGLNSFINVPMLVRDTVVGVITLVAAESGRRFDELDVALGEELASRAATAVDNARLYQAAEENAETLRASEQRLTFLAEASAVLASSLDVDDTLTGVAYLAVPRLADWCAIDLAEDDGGIRRVAHAHADPAKVERAREFLRRYPPDPDATAGVANVLRTGQPELVTEVDEDRLRAVSRDRPELYAAMLELGLRSTMVLPMIARGRTVGAITLSTAESERAFGEHDVALADLLARRVAIAVDNARLFQAAEERARAAQALTFVGDGVFLVDAYGVIRLWNPAAATITGLAEVEVVGRPAGEAIPGWDRLVSRVPIAGPHDATVRAETLPLEVGGIERWLSISGVGFEEGTVFAFRDLTEERGVERMKSDFVSTVSHELRTPLAAIYGAAVTLRREDMPLEPQQRSDLLGVIATEADRLARIVNDILWASRLDAQSVPFSIGAHDAREIAEQIVATTRIRLPENVDLDLVTPAGLPPLAADPDKLSQVLANLVENAVKYSPGGGRVEVRVEQSDGVIRFRVSDEGLGIPPAERERVFEKFYRLDPNLTQGVGGTGLGLYICRELVSRMDGQIWVEPKLGPGTTVVVELPAAEKATEAASS
jgi:PAS domain S-box-containing protein